MRKIKNIVSTGCFFLCLGGWVYNGPVKAADQATLVREAALNGAVAQAVSPETATRDTQIAQVGEPAAPAVPAATRPAAASGPNVDLTAAVVNVGVDGRVEQLSF